MFWRSPILFGKLFEPSFIHAETTILKVDEFGFTDTTSLTTSFGDLILTLDISGYSFAHRSL